jgi:hypothetical protein
MNMHRVQHSHIYTHRDKNLCMFRKHLYFLREKDSINSLVISCIVTHTNLLASNHITENIHIYTVS